MPAPVNPRSIPAAPAAAPVAECFSRSATAQLLLDAGQVGAARNAATHLQAILQNSATAAAVSGQVALAEGRFEEALGYFHKTEGAWALIGVAMAEHSLGHAAASQAALDELRTRYAGTLGYQIAEVYAWRGEDAQALTWLERAFRQHDGGLVYVRHDRFFTNLRGAAAYRKLLVQLKLPP